MLRDFTMKELLAPGPRPEPGDYKVVSHGRGEWCVLPEGAVAKCYAILEPHPPSGDYSRIVAASVACVLTPEEWSVRDAALVLARLEDGDRRLRELVEGCDGVKIVAWTNDGISGVARTAIERGV